VQQHGQQQGQRRRGSAYGAAPRSPLRRACPPRVQVYLVVLTVRILLSWFRNINWFGEPFNTLRQVGTGRAHFFSVP
jgi:hypothetical protein